MEYKNPKQNKIIKTICRTTLLPYFNLIFCEIDRYRYQGGEGRGKPTMQLQLKEG